MTIPNYKLCFLFKGGTNIFAFQNFQDATISRLQNSLFLKGAKSFFALPFRIKTWDFLPHRQPWQCPEGLVEGMTVEDGF